MLQNILQRTGQPPMAKNYLAQDVKSVKVEKVTKEREHRMTKKNPKTKKQINQEFQGVNPELVSSTLLLSTCQTTFT